MASKRHSSYSAAFTGGGFLFVEMDGLLPLFLSPDSAELVKEEIAKNEILHINSESSRKRIVAELKRRFDAVPTEFWTRYGGLNDKVRKVSLFYVLLKTYKILFDLHVNVTVKRWQCSKTSVSLPDMRMEFNKIASRDEFVSSWSEETRDKVTSSYLTILRKVGILDANSDGLRRVPLTSIDSTYFIEQGESWFFEACLMMPFEIKNLQQG